MWCPSLPRRERNVVVLPKEIMYVRIDDFASLDAGTQINAAFRSPECAKAKGLIVDLRGNHGGLFGAGLNLLSAGFGGKSKICTMRTAQGTQPMALRTFYKQKEFRDRAVILVDRETASCA